VMLAQLTLSATPTLSRYVTVDSLFRSFVLPF
jgi:hypothetical protein